MNSNVFLGRLKTKGNNVDWLVHMMKDKGVKVTSSTIYKKLRGESEFTAPEIKVISEIMDFTKDEMYNIFFEELVS